MLLIIYKKSMVKYEIINSEYSKYGGKLVQQYDKMSAY